MKSENSNKLFWYTPSSYYSNNYTQTTSIRKLFPNNNILHIYSQFLTDKSSVKAYNFHLIDLMNTSWYYKKSRKI